MSQSHLRRLRTTAVTTALVAGLSAGLVTLPFTTANATEATSPVSTVGKKLLTADFDHQSRSIRVGQQFKVSGTIATVTQGDVGRPGDGVPARFTLAVSDATGEVLGTQEVTAAGDGTFSTMVPGSVTRGLETGARDLVIGVRAVDATYGDFASADAGATAVTVGATSTTLQIENSFVSSVGWVKPGESYPSRIIVTNPTESPIAGATVKVTAPRGSLITAAGSGGVITSAGKTVTWAVPVIAAKGSQSMVLESRAATVVAEPTIVWRDLSTTAELTLGGVAAAPVTSHGPKVIPPNETYDSARYGDRPFPVVPIQYLDRPYQAEHSGDQLEQIINDPTFDGSTFNLFQEMSLGQLFPNGTVPSAGIATADFTYAKGFPFTKRAMPGNTCQGYTLADVPGSIPNPVNYPERITDGIYNLPGDTGYYGSDSNGTAITGSVTGVGTLQDIDSGCGPTGKMVFDAAALADPEIDYSDYDTDKDGVVDFFMAVFAGCGGNGSSQLTVLGCDYPDAPYDNVWPHSSSLEYYYTDPATGLAGFTTDDQLKDLEGRLLFYTDASRTDMTTTTTEFPVFVRVGPYNVNPETAIDAASVISHEYGHSLGLPDFYSTGNRDTYGDWNLMATDKSQNMDAFSRQELGWVVPQVLEPGETRTASAITDSKEDTDTIVWQRPDGTPYTLTEGVDGRVQNSAMYVAKLPGRQLLDPAKFDTGETATKKHAWWSGSGNDFGCTPQAGRNLDFSIPGLATLPAGTTARLSMKSLWDIEWDYDYGYVLTTVDNGKSYTSRPSLNGYTTSNTDPSAGNPNQNGCQATFNNGLTGSSGSYEAGSEALDRKTGDVPDPVFLSDSYDITNLVGKPNGALRFSYATDPGLARPGWFIDDLKVTVTEPGKAPYDIFATDFESDGGPDDGRVFNGGCREDLTVAQSCTLGWKFLEAGAASEQDHAYYLEMRDRSGFDFDGHGQADRGGAAFQAGLYLAYTDEAHGYGNAGTDDPPAQTPLDATPTPGSSSPNLNDAAFTAAAGRKAFSDAGQGHTDNYRNPANTERDSRYPSVANPWRFRYDCLGFEVLAMTGNENGPGPSSPAGGDLTGDVRFTMGAGCAEFDYGYEPKVETPNTAPVAEAGPETLEASTGETVTFDGTGSTDAEDPNSLDYSWNFDDGAPAKDASGAVVEHAFDTAGEYAVELLVTDPQGLTDTDTIVVTVTEAPNTAPDARMKVSPNSPFVKQRVKLDARGSSDAETDGRDLTYSWNFGDGGSKVDATTRVARVRYREAGNHRITLTVTDPRGAKDVTRQKILVRRSTGCGDRSVAWTGSWRMVQSDSRGGSHCDNKGRGRGQDTLTTTITGPRVDLWHGRARDGGAAKVFIDGVKVGSLRFRNNSRTPKMRYHRTFAGLGRGEHEVRVVVTRGAAYMEGFVTIR
ncbi:PKD domain-containing protein [Nocardioides sp.]|uniref:PKD domain-containing protein n=1 Tax=Nocardioides sp. TaxID=35761 RepID=UPI0035631453